MSREIKFRVWNQNAKGWVLNNGNGEKFGVFGPLNTLTNSFGEDGLVYQQYTGLKDSTGKEIYEGDIVFTIYPEYKIAKVFFCANSASFRLLSGNVALPMVTMRTQEGQSPKLINVFEKVIGNIFETPELLA